MWTTGKRRNSDVNPREEKELPCGSQGGEGTSCGFHGNMGYSRVWFLVMGRNFIARIPERGGNSLIHGLLGEEWPTCG